MEIRNMLLAELKDKIIKPLPRSDKLQLIVDITKMLQQEEERPENYLKKGGAYPVMTPTITPDSTSIEAAVRLQRLLKEHKNT